jgi:hypothetical protein
MMAHAQRLVEVRLARALDFVSAIGDGPVDVGAAAELDAEQHGRPTLGSTSPLSGSMTHSITFNIDV